MKMKRKRANRIYNKFASLRFIRNRKDKYYQEKASEYFTTTNCKDEYYIPVPLLKYDVKLIEGNEYKATFNVKMEMIR